MKYAADDGTIFETRAEVRAYEKEMKMTAKRSEATQALRNLLTARVPSLDPEEVDAVVEAVAPLLKGQRKPRSDVGVPRGPRKSQPAKAAA